MFHCHADAAAMVLCLGDGANAGLWHLKDVLAVAWCLSSPVRTVAVR